MDASKARLWTNTGRLIVALFLYGTVAWSRRKKRKLQADGQAWPSVDGRIDGAQVQFVRSNCSVASFTYDYFIEEYRSGTYSREFSNRADAEAFVALLKGKPLPVRYNPLKPDESVVESADIAQRYGPVSA